MAQPRLPLPEKSVSGPLRDNLRKVAVDLAGWTNGISFPGAQPVSFEAKHLVHIQQKKYYACEKTDGVRYMLLITPKGSFMIDRNFDLKQVSMIFPLRDNPAGHHSKTFLDGELVCDKLDTGAWEWRYLIYDMIALNGASVAHRPLSQRLKLVQNHILTPRARAVQPPASPEPFKLFLKEFYEVRHVPWIFDSVIPRLLHHNDGIIFTRVDTPYSPGTDQTLLKWKPATLNTVDFLLEVQTRRREPRFALMIGDKSTQKFQAYITLSAEDRAMFEQLHKQSKANRAILECVWDPEWDHYEPSSNKNDGWQENGQWHKGGWRYLRIRDDKTTPNDISVLNRIGASYKDNVTHEQLVEVAQQLQERHLKGASASAAAAHDSDSDSDSGPAVKRSRPDAAPEASFVAAQEQAQYIPPTAAAPRAPPTSTPHSFVSPFASAHTAPHAQHETPQEHNAQYSDGGRHNHEHAEEQQNETAEEERGGVGGGGWEDEDWDDNGDA